MSRGNHDFFQQVEVLEIKISLEILCKKYNLTAQAVLLCTWYESTLEILKLTQYIPTDLQHRML